MYTACKTLLANKLSNKCPRSSINNLQINFRFFEGKFFILHYFEKGLNYLPFTYINIKNLTTLAKAINAYVFKNNFFGKLTRIGICLYG